MINLNDVLLAMSNIPVSDPIAEIWGRGLQGGYKIIEYTDSLPITITANGDVLLDYRIYGASGGVGVAAENLYGSENEMGNIHFGTGTNEYSNARTRTKDYISVKPSTTYTLKYNLSNVNFAARQYTNSTYVGYSEWQSNGSSFVTGDTTTKIRFIFKSPEQLQNIMLVEGTVEPTDYIPYGYKLPITVQSVNLFDKNAKDVDKGFVLNKVFNADGSVGYSSLYSISEYIQVEPLKEYFLENFHNPAWQRAYNCACFYDSNKNVLSVISARDNDSLILTAPELARFIRISVYFPTCKFYSSMPQKENIYIGENQLDAGEYVSYGEQKIYRDVDGTLTPTDPPVPLPEIPTVDGTTVIDYDGDPKPSQMYVKYRR